MTLLASLRDWLKAQQLDAVLLSSRQNKQPHLGISTGSGYVVISRESAHILVDSRYYVEVEARAQGSLRDWLKAQQLDAVLLSSRQNKQPHLGISTGSGYVVISRASAHILVDSRYYGEVEARAQGSQLHLLDATNTLTTIVNQIIADEQLQTLGFEGQQVSWETAHRWQSELNAKLVSATPDVLRQIKTPEEVEKQLQTLGFEGQQVSWETAHRWQSELNAKLVSATPDVLRQIKTPEEVEKIRLACGIADRGAEHIRRFIQAGMSEREIAAELEWFMRQQGAEKASFDTIVARGLPIAERSIFAALFRRG